MASCLFTRSHVAVRTIERAPIWCSVDLRDGKPGTGRKPWVPSAKPGDV